MIVVADDVARARAAGQPVVTLESTVFSRLGLPDPHGRQALRACLEAIRDEGAVPAVTAVLDGHPHVGVPAEAHERLLAGDRKCAARDLPVAVAQRWAVGATTVSASLLLTAAVGLPVFATGGIGGVHRDASTTDDVSADLDALARYPVVTVCAGAKGFLDLARTLERLESASVPVLGLATDEFPAFTGGASGLPVQARVDTVGDAAAIVRAHRQLDRTSGVLLAVPLPPAAAVPHEVIDRATQEALRAADELGIRGPGVTPFVLERTTEATGGANLDANVALVVRNAQVAARLAAALA